MGCYPKLDFGAGLRPPVAAIPVLPYVLEKTAVKIDEDVDTSLFSVEYRAIVITCCHLVSQSQRDRSINPRVARNELPWVRIESDHNPEKGCIYVL